ncbi:Peroxisome chaperone and import receptor [Mycoemilia scoparia]|uniref:Peroxisome chaperone and import receptor n=1 Tax=Mycoemilia scoparia TaxID=417184 RepID=A0A9W7ZXS8_9FUNG|nr:Peroxisome chaperone and import receptor [Mycoemilia scoparia]
MSKHNNDDEFDDILDSVLQEFSKPEKPKSKPPATKAAATTSTGSKPKLAAGAGTAKSQKAENLDFDFGKDFDPNNIDLNDDELAEKLTKGMEALLSGIQGGDEDIQATMNELMKEFESFKSDLSDDDKKQEKTEKAPSSSNAAAAAASKKSEESSSSASAQKQQQTRDIRSANNTNKDKNLKESLKSQSTDTTADAGSSKPRATFQETIQQTMNKLKESSDRAEAETAASSSNHDDMLEQLLKQMEGLGGTAGTGDDSQFEGMFENMFSMFMSKEMLYEPMTDLNKEYPKYLEANKGKIDAADYERYQKQYGCVKEILKAFDEMPKGKEDTPENEAKIKELMEKMQSYGQPPEELLKHLAPDMDFGQDGEPKMPAELDQCNQM